MRSRINVTVSCLAVLYLILAGRLFFIQIIKGQEYKKIAKAETVREITIQARRGTIYDRNRNKLAVTVDAYDIAARPAAMKDKAAVAKALAPLIGKDETDLRDTFERHAKYTYLERRIDADKGTAIKKAKLPGIDVTLTTKRIYPHGTLAAHILGFTNIDGKGIEGIEKSYDSYLKGSNGTLVAEVDARGRIIPGTEQRVRQPVNGKDLVLTIDYTLQHSLETELAKSYNDHSAAGASAVMMDPKTGEIIALANMPTFDPNKVANSTAASRRNRAITDTYEPGSTLKSITACGALEEHAIRPTDTFACNGSMKIGRRTIRCSVHAPFVHGHGACNVAKMLTYSCNMAAARIGLKLGKEKLNKYEKAFGVYEVPIKEMPGAVTAWHDNWEDWGDVRLANIAFGQGIAVTPLQIARAYCAIADGGVLRKPYVVKAILNSDGEIYRSGHPEMTRRVISPATSRMVCKALGTVVSDGTARRTAQVEGYQVGGKTGSAQKAVPGKGYAAGGIVASFAGFLPLSNPRVVILVAVDEPKGSHFGATVAGPVFQKVAKKAMWRFKVPPDAPDDDATMGAGFTGRKHAQRSLPTAQPQRG